MVFILLIFTIAKAILVYLFLNFPLMSQSILQSMQQLKATNQKALAVLIDPDHFSQQAFQSLVHSFDQHQPDYFLVGGSHLTSDQVAATIQGIKRHSAIPIILFPGSTHQICDEADAILLLSLISGRNPDLLIGKHVEAAPQLMQSSLEVIPTGYMLVDGGKSTTVHYISQTIPLPSDKPELAVSTAWAGELMGLRVNYLDAGSGARQTVPEAMIAEMSRQTKNPLVVGGGIRTGERAYQLCEAGADVVVVGNALEKSPTLVSELLAATHAFNTMHTKIKSKH